MLLLASGVEVPGGGVELRGRISLSEWLRYA